MIASDKATYLSAVLGVPISLSTSYDKGGKKLIARPEVLPPGHGFVFCCRRPYADMVTAEMQLDSYGSDIVNAWKKRRSETAAGAFSYVADARYDMRVILRIGDKTIETAEELISVPDQYWTARNTSLRFVLQSGTLSDVDLCILEGSIGFALLLAGYQRGEDEDVENSCSDKEGEPRVTSSTRYERSWSNRLSCIAHYGAKCAVCGFDFGVAYGAEFSGMIEIHHIRPISTYGGPVKIDPSKDLIPLCPNCHAAIHLTNPPLSPEELSLKYQKRNEVR